MSPFLFLIEANGMNVMMNATVEASLFTGYKVDVFEVVSIYHLHLAGDTLLVRGKSCANVRALKVILIIFSVISGFKVNSHKSLLIGINIIDS